MTFRRKESFSIWIRIALPKNSLGKSLDRFVLFCDLQSFCGKQTVFSVGFDCNKPPIQLLCHHRCCAASGERVQYLIAFVRAGQNYLGEQLFRLLCRVVGIFGIDQNGTLMLVQRFEGWVSR